MTAPPAALCGHRWRIQLWGRPHGLGHRCQLDADHLTDPVPMPRPHRCGCGATTEAQEAGGIYRQRYDR